MLTLISWRTASNGDSIHSAPDPIIRHLERQDEYWRANPRDEEITYRPGWDERWELMLEETQMTEHDMPTIPYLDPETSALYLPPEDEGEEPFLLKRQAG